MWLSVASGVLIIRISPNDCKPICPQWVIDHLCPIWRLSSSGHRAGGADLEHQQGPGIHLDYSAQLFLRHLWNPKDLNFLCSRPGVPVVSCFQTFWDFSKFSHWLHLTSVPSWEVILVAGLWNMQLVSLTGSTELSPGLCLASVTWTHPFLWEVWGIIFLLSFSRKGWLGKQVNRGCPTVAERSCWPSPEIQTACPVLEMHIFCFFFKL